MVALEKLRFRMTRKPDFVIVGASKAGTSSFSEMLEQHPQIELTRPREPNFFSCHYEKGWGWYEERFPKPVEGGIFGEKSPTYTWVQAFPNVAERLVRDLPHAKLVYVVRHPADRIVSRWMQDSASGTLQRGDDFNSAVRRNVNGIVDTTRYLQQIDVYRRYFSDDRIQVVFFEELVAKPAEVMANAFRYLGVDADFSLAKVSHHNKSLGKREDGKLLIRLRRYLPKDTRRLPVPERVRTTARKLLKRKVDTRPSWDDRTRAWLRQELGDEIKDFLRRYRGDENYWQL